MAMTGYEIRKKISGHLMAMDKVEVIGFIAPAMRALVRFSSTTIDADIVAVVSQRVVGIVMPWKHHGESYVPKTGQTERESPAHPSQRSDQDQSQSKHPYRHSQGNAEPDKGIGQDLRAGGPPENPSGK